MSYSAVVPITLYMGDGVTPLMVAQLPIEEISRTFFEVGGEKAKQVLPALVNQAIEIADGYATAALWPTVRSEVDRATANAESRTMTLAKTAGKQALAYGSLAAIAVGAIGWYLTKGRRL